MSYDKQLHNILNICNDFSSILSNLTTVLFSNYTVKWWSWRLSFFKEKYYFCLRENVMFNSVLLDVSVIICEIYYQFLSF